MQTRITGLRHRKAGVWGRGIPPFLWLSVSQQNTKKCQGLRGWAEVGGEVWGWGGRGTYKTASRNVWEEMEKRKHRDCRRAQRTRLKGASVRSSWIGRQVGPLSRATFGLEVSEWNTWKSSVWEPGRSVRGEQGAWALSSRDANKGSGVLSQLRKGR